MTTSELMSSVGARAWWAYHCLPRDKRGKPPAQTATEKEHKLSRGLLGKLFSGKQHTVDREIAPRLAEALGVSVDFIERGLGEWPKPTGDVPPRVVLWRGQQELPEPVQETVRPEHRTGVSSASLNKMQLERKLRQLAASKVHNDNPLWDRDEIDEAVEHVAAFRSAVPLTVERLAKMTEYILQEAKGEVTDEIVVGALPFEPLRIPATTPRTTPPSPRRR